MAPGHPTDGRVLSAAGEPPTSAPAGRADPAQRKWEEAHEPQSPQIGAPDPGASGIVESPTGSRVSPDPLLSTDRYRLVTPFKLKL